MMVPCDDFESQVANSVFPVGIDKCHGGANESVPVALCGPAVVY